MRSLVFAMLATVAVASTASAQDAKAKGEQAFAAQKCSICHSIAGKGNAKGSLDGVGAKLTPDEIRAWIVDAKGMAANTKAPRKPAMRQYTLPQDEVASRRSSRSSTTGRIWTSMYDKHA